MSYKTDNNRKDEQESWENLVTGESQRERDQRHYMIYFPLESSYSMPNVEVSSCQLHRGNGTCALKKRLLDSVARQRALPLCLFTKLESKWL